MICIWLQSFCILKSNVSFVENISFTLVTFKSIPTLHTSTRSLQPIHYNKRQTSYHYRLAMICIWLQSFCILKSNVSFVENISFTLVTFKSIPTLHTRSLQLIHYNKRQTSYHYRLAMICIAGCGRLMANGD